MDVVSFCLYGTTEYYRAGALRNAELCRTIYPGWQVRFYVSATIPESLNERLRQLGARVIVVPEAADNPFFMHYRYLPCTDPAVELAIFRDTDSRVDGREAAAVGAWLESGKGLHVMRDHLWHRPQPDQYMILGGMWGVRCGKLRDIAELSGLFAADVEYGSDQRLLTRHVYPRFAAADDICVHDDLFDRKPFPTGRTWLTLDGERLPLFVGCQFGSDDRPLYVEHLRGLRAHLEREEAAAPLGPPTKVPPAPQFWPSLGSRIRQAWRAWLR